MSRTKRVLKALGLDDEFDELFGVKPKGRARGQQRVPSQNPLAVQLNRAAEQSRRALPAPPKPLALPAPGPGLPSGASKPRGGQFWTGKADATVSPDDVARKQAEEASYRFIDFVPEEGEGVLRMDAPQANVAQDWLARALAKYYKTDFGSPEDPLRDLAARGLHYDPDMTPERWQATVNSYLLEDPIEQILFPPNAAGGMPGAGSDLRGETLAAMPWLAKQPVTDKVYGISGGGLDIEHFADEFANALNPEMSGLPMDLAVRPESLARMTFPQAVERVGRINQFRAKKMEEEAAAALDNPAIQTFKEYPDAGYRWVELKAPDEIDAPEFSIADQSYTQRGIRIGDQYYNVPFNMETGSADYEGYARDIAKRDALQSALKYEGDTMGHCVGGYCPDVMSGRSRIFSLRDAKGQPHVTIETSPGDQSEVYRQAIADLRDTEYWPAWLQNQQDRSRAGNFGSTADLVKYMNEFRASQGLEPIGMDFPQDIIQIKGKQNRAPKDDYLPFVQDFVKSGTWGNVGDVENTGLVRLPDGRYITTQQWQEGLAAIEAPWRDPGQYDERYLDRLSQAEWQSMLPYFEGFAIGGRVDADRCFSRNPMSVR